MPYHSFLNDSIFCLQLQNAADALVDAGLGDGAAVVGILRVARRTSAPPFRAGSSSAAVPPPGHQVTDLQDNRY